MRIDLLLSNKVCRHFGIASKSLPRDTEVVLTDHWLAYWRLEHLADVDNSPMTVFYATNLATRYTLVLTNTDKVIETLEDQFLNSLLEILVRYGIKGSGPLEVAVGHLRGNPRSLIGTMNDVSVQALSLTRNKELSRQELNDELNRIPHSPVDGYFPDAAFAERAKADPPTLVRAL